MSDHLSILRIASKLRVTDYTRFPQSVARVNDSIVDLFVLLCALFPFARCRALYAHRSLSHRAADTAGPIYLPAETSHRQRRSGLRTAKRGPLRGWRAIGSPRRRSSATAGAVVRPTTLAQRKSARGRPGGGCCASSTPGAPSLARWALWVGDRPDADNSASATAAPCRIDRPPASGHRPERRDGRGSAAAQGDRWRGGARCDSTPTPRECATPHCPPDSRFTCSTHGVAYKRFAAERSAAKRTPTPARLPITKAPTRTRAGGTLQSAGPPVRQP